MSGDDFTRVAGPVETTAHWMPCELEKMAMHDAALACAAKNTKQNRRRFREARDAYDAARARFLEDHKRLMAIVHSATPLNVE
jgi:hypothetical protein